MSITIRAQMHLQSGARLYYDCPLMSGDNFKADQFFRSHRGKWATFVDYAKKYVGPLDHYGRVPGTYIRDGVIRVKFDGEDGELTLNLLHFILLDPTHAILASEFQDGDRLGDLPNPILFYSGDIVVVASDLLAQEREVRHPFIDDTGVVMYDVLELEETRQHRIREMPAERKASDSPSDIFHKRSVEQYAKGRYSDRLHACELRLVRRGNEWALYNDPSKLVFESDNAEFLFWAQDGVTRSVKRQNIDEEVDMVEGAFGVSFEIAQKLFDDGQGDLIIPSPSSTEKKVKYFARRLNDCFGEHRDRVRSFSHRYWVAHSPLLTE